MKTNVIVISPPIPYLESQVMNQNILIQSDYKIQEGIRGSRKKVMKCIFGLQINTEVFF